MYLWRKLSANQQAELLEFRRFNRRPWHSPLHFESQSGAYLLTGACYEHRHIIGTNPQRIAMFAEQFLTVLDAGCETVHAWCILPNHYHALVLTRKLPELLAEIGKLHGRTSFAWNGEDNSRGRKVWFNCAETGMKSERHFWATLNYFHHNPVHHGYVRQWQDWPFSSGAAFLEQAGHERATEIWKEYPIQDYGKNWDAADL